MLFDSHAHLDHRSFGEDVEDVVARARDAGVGAILTIGASADPDELRSAVALAHRHPWIRAAVGVHPHEAAKADETTFAALEALLPDPAVVALGEVGLDYHYDFAPRDVQIDVFRRQIALAVRAGRPLVIHCREAHDDCLRILSGGALPTPAGVIHCYSSDLPTAQRYLALGFLISIPGIVTFRKSGDLADVVRGVPMERLLLETDSPYLAPEPFRGRRNEPAFVRSVAEAVARIRGLSPEDVARITTRNAATLFGMTIPEAEGPSLAYSIRDSLYVNVTNRCTLACTFCHKHRDWVVRGHDLHLPGDPSEADLRAAIEASDPARWSEVVFCGYGEPLLRPDVVIAIAGDLKARGLRTRVNTDGLSSLVHGRDIPAELAGRIDCVSVSLNAPDAATYAHYCRSRHGAAAFDAVCAFIRRAREVLPEVWATAVALPGLDVEAVRRLAEDVLGVRFRARPYDELG